MQLSFSATTDETTIREGLGRLLVPGALRDPSLLRRIERIADSFRRYADSCPLPLWAPHLAVDQEMRAMTEALFPVQEVRGAFRALLSTGCRFKPLLEHTVLHSAATWLDVLQGLHPALGQADPSPLLASLAADGDARRNFLFTLFLPRHYGASFERYPVQARWLGSWLVENRGRLQGRVRGADCACGSGEGTYRLAELISASGYDPGASLVVGSTFEPVELFAAAHGYFPHDPQREAAYRERIVPLLKGAMRVVFRLEDVVAEGEGGYDVVLCNGLVGGPMLWEREQVRVAIEKLAGRLAGGGILLVADRFHAGWKKRVPERALEEIMKACGLEAVQVPEGVGARRPC